MMELEELNKKSDFFLMIQKEARFYVNSDLRDFCSFSATPPPTAARREVEKEPHRIKAKR